MSSRLRHCHDHSSPGENPGEPGATKAQVPAVASPTLGTKICYQNVCGVWLLPAQKAANTVWWKVCFISDTSNLGGGESTFGQVSLAPPTLQGAEIWLFFPTIWPVYWLLSSKQPEPTQLSLKICHISIKKGKNHSVISINKKSFWQNQSFYDKNINTLAREWIYFDRIKAM